MKAKQDRASFGYFLKNRKSKFFLFISSLLANDLYQQGGHFDATLYNSKHTQHTLLSLNLFLSQWAVDLLNPTQISQRQKI